MLKLLSYFTNRKLPQTRDAKRIYARLMQASRDPVFYGDGKCADTMTGRAEILYLHLGIMHYVLRRHGQDGKVLSQALYDVMVEDFDIALREEGISDSGLKRRIKPMVKMFYARAKNYADALQESDIAAAMETIITDNISDNGEFAGKTSKYAELVYSEFDKLSLGQLARAGFWLPTKL